MEWLEIKTLIAETSGLHRDALHVYASVIGVIGAALLIKRPLATPWPWLAMLVAAVMNEALDLTNEIWPRREQQYIASVHDLWNTMVAPTILLLATRFTPGLFERHMRTLDHGPPLDS